MPLGDGLVWDETLPDNNVQLTDGDDHQLHTRKAVRIRLDKEHVWPSSQANTATAGYHRFITFQPQASSAAPHTLITATTAGAIAFVSYGTGYSFQVAVATDTSLRLINDDLTFNHGLISPSGMTAGDIIISTGTSSFSRLPLASSDKSVLVSNATTAPAWSKALVVTSVTATGLTSATLLVSGTSTLSGNVLMSAAATISGTFTAPGRVLAPNQFGTGVVKNENTTYQAASDGYLVLSFYRGDQVHINTFVSTNQALVDSEDASVGVTQRSTDAGGIGYAYMCIPILKGEYYRFEATAGSTALKKVFIPLGA